MLGDYTPEEIGAYDGICPCCGQDTCWYEIHLYPETNDADGFYDVLFEFDNLEG